MSVPPCTNVEEQAVCLNSRQVALQSNTSWSANDHVPIQEIPKFPEAVGISPRPHGVLLGGTATSRRCFLKQQ